MFSRDQKPRRIHMMSLGVLNLPRLPVLDWAFGHSIISCHVEHHLFPKLSDNMCLKVGGWSWRAGNLQHSPEPCVAQLAWSEGPSGGLRSETRGFLISSATQQAHGPL